MCIMVVFSMNRISGFIVLENTSTVCASHSHHPLPPHPHRVCSHSSISPFSLTWGSVWPLVLGQHSSDHWWSRTWRSLIATSLGSLSAGRTGQERDRKERGRKERGEWGKGNRGEAPMHVVAKFEVFPSPPPSLSY